MASDEEREAYSGALNGFDMYKACVEGLRIRLGYDIEDARNGNRSPELLKEIHRKIVLLRKADGPMGTAEIEGTLIAHGIEIGEITVQ